MKREALDAEVYLSAGSGKFWSGMLYQAILSIRAGWEVRALEKPHLALMLITRARAPFLKPTDPFH
jgi:hypothetical protein